MRYAIVIAKAEKNYGAYVPDLPGCVATGKTVEETVQQLREATELHLEGLRDGGEPITRPTSLLRLRRVAMQWPTIDQAPAAVSFAAGPFR
jgi:predicted RNase H-like HicB family nuclease